MKVLVLGGTGAIGVHLTRILAETNTVYVTSRKEHVSTDHIHYIKGNAHDKQFILSLLKGESFDAIVDFMSYKTNEFASVFEVYLHNTSQYVFLSSSRVYADSVDGLLVESSPRLLDSSEDNNYLKTDEYALSKARQENYLINSPNKNWTIIRPYITYSENRLQLGVLEKEAWLFRAINGHAIVFSKDIINHLTTLTYGYDVSKGIASIIGKKSALGRIFHITGEDCCTWGDVLNVYLKTIYASTHKKTKVVLQEKSIRLRFDNTKYQVKYDRCYNRRFNNTNISAYIDIHTFVPIKEGVEMCLQEFLKNPSFLQINIKEQALFDRVSKEVYSKEVFGDVKSYVVYLIYRYCVGIEYFDLIRSKLGHFIKKKYS